LLTISTERNRLFILWEGYADVHSRLPCAAYKRSGEAWGGAIHQLRCTSVHISPREVIVEILAVVSVILSAVGVGLGLAGVILGVASLVRRRR
jgi:hypothetical protein